MGKFKVLDLSFCEALQKDDIEIVGGVSPSEILSQSPLFSFLNKFLTSPVDNYPVVTTLPGETEYIVRKVENKATGESGYIMSDKTGTLRSGTIKSPNSTTSFAITSNSFVLPL